MPRNIKKRIKNASGQVEEVTFTETSRVTVTLINRTVPVIERAINSFEHSFSDAQVKAIALKAAGDLEREKVIS